MADFGEGVRAPSERPLVVTPEEALEMNARVRDLRLLDDTPPQAGDTPHTYPVPFLSDPRPLALQIIRALRDLHSMTETSILVSEEECWFLERRFRHNDREPCARTLCKKLHILLLEFHPELAPVIPEEDLGPMPEVEDNADQSYEDAIKGADPDSDPAADEGSGQGTGAIPTE